MKLSHWARKQGISYLTAWRWFKAGKLPVPARQLPSSTILVEEPNPEGCTVLYARVSSFDQKDDLQRQVQRLEAFAREQGWLEFQVVTEIASCLRKSVCPTGKATPPPVVACTDVARPGTGPSGLLVTGEARILW